MVMTAFAEIRTYSMEQFTFCKMIRKISWAISLMIRLNFDLLDFCNPNVTKCFGCQGHFRQNNQLPECPRNLIIVSKMRRPYRGKDGNMKEGTFSNVYFHLSEKCVKKQDPYLITSLVFCHSDLKWHFLNIANACQQQASSLNWHFVLLCF